MIVLLREGGEERREGGRGREEEGREKGVYKWRQETGQGMEGKDNA